MKIVLLLCAAFALSTATEPVEEVAAAQETHPDVEPPVQMLDRIQEKEVVGVEMGSVFPRITCPIGWARYGNRCFIFIYTQKTWAEAETLSSKAPLKLWHITLDNTQHRLTGGVYSVALGGCSSLHHLSTHLQVKVEGHGSWAAEDSVPAEERQEGSREEERSGRGPEDCSKGRTGPHLPRLPDTDARPEDFQAAF